MTYSYLLPDVQNVIMLTTRNKLVRVQLCILRDKT